VGTTGHYIIWGLTDLTVNAPNYSILYNGTVNATGSCVFNASNEAIILIDINGLVIGHHNFTIHFADGYGIEISDVVIVTVQNTIPNITTPANIAYVVGTQSNWLNWTIIDETAKTPNYTVYINGTIFETGSWKSGLQICLNIDELDLGIFNFTIIATDGYNATITDEVFVSVQNTITKINSPDNITFYLGDLGHNISWIIIDESVGIPSFTLYQNATAILNNTWISGQAVNFSVDNLTLGIYNFTIVVTDGYGVVVQDEVWVTILNVLPIITQVPDLTIQYDVRNISVSWIVTDPNLNASIYTIYLNETVYSDGTWFSGQNISLGFANFTAGIYNITIIASDGYGAQVEDQVYVTIEQRIKVPVAIQIISPANGSICEAAFDLTLTFEITGEGTFQKYWYQLNTAEWIEITGNTTINLYQPGRQTIQIIGLSDTNENISSPAHTFYLDIQNDPLAKLNIIASTTAMQFTQDSIIQVKITIRNTGQIQLNHIQLRIFKVTNEYYISTNFVKNIPGGLAPGEEISYTMEVEIRRASITLNFSGDLLTNNLHINIIFQLSTESDAEINIVWPIAGGSAGVVVLGAVIYSISKKKGPRSSKRESKIDNEPTMDPDVNFIL
jgi:hypothetical protein